LKPFLMGGRRVGAFDQIDASRGGAGRLAWILRHTDVALQLLVERHNVFYLRILLQTGIYDPHRTTLV